MPNNVFNIPSFGKPIELSDQGIYYAVNRQTGSINNVFHLKYDDEDWLLYQLKNTGKNNEMGWIILADNGDYPLKSAGLDETKKLFDKPEYAEPKGSWQLVRNSRYGFGKFTPSHADEPIKFAMVLFSGSQMLVPLLILKADDGLLQSLAEPLL